MVNVLCVVFMCSCFCRIECLHVFIYVCRYSCRQLYLLVSACMRVFVFRELNLCMCSYVCMCSCPRVCLFLTFSQSFIKDVDHSGRRNCWKPNWLANDVAYLRHLSTLARNICNRFLRSRGRPCSKNVASGARMSKRSRKLVARDSMTYICNQ